MQLFAGSHLKRLCDINVPCLPVFSQSANLQLDSHQPSLWPSGLHPASLPAILSAPQRHITSNSSLPRATELRPGLSGSQSHLFLAPSRRTGSQNPHLQSCILEFPNHGGLQFLRNNSNLLFLQFLWLLQSPVSLAPPARLPVIALQFCSPVAGFLLCSPAAGLCFYSPSSSLASTYAAGFQVIFPAVLRYCFALRPCIPGCPPDLLCSPAQPPAPPLELSE